MYSAESISNLQQDFALIQPMYEALMPHYSKRQYRTGASREFAVQGFLRRMGTLKRCIENVFELLPVDFTGVPDKKTVDDSVIAVQAFIFNVFGCLDNLAWIWVEEKQVRKADGQKLPRNWVGFGSKHVTVRESFGEDFQNYLATRADWFSHLENYRNALAHRIPLYIPPYCVKPENEARYHELDQMIFADTLAANTAAKAQHEAEQDALKFFKPFMKHSFEENAPIMIVHAQMLADFLTVDEFAWKIRGQLDQIHTQSTPPA